MCIRDSTKRLWKEYVKSPKPPCVNWKDEGALTYPWTSDRGATVATHIEVDVVGCRYNAFYHAPDIPVFGPMDDMQPVTSDQELPDLIYVTKACAEPRNASEILHLLPFRGSGWYARPAIEYCLHTRKLEWSDLQWGVTAMGRIPGDHLRAAST